MSSRGEPLPDESPLWELENVVVTPHLAGRSDRYVEQALAIVEPNVRAFLAGRREDIVNVVDRRVRMRIDAHAHVAPPEYVEALPIPIPVPSPLDGLKRFMARYAIDRAVISTGPPGAPSPEIARIGQRRAGGDRPRRARNVRRARDTAARERGRRDRGGRARTRRARPRRCPPALERPRNVPRRPRPRPALRRARPARRVRLPAPVDAAARPAAAAASGLAVRVRLRDDARAREPDLQRHARALSERAPAGRAPRRDGRRSSRAGWRRSPNASPTKAAGAPAGALEYLRRLYYDTGSRTTRRASQRRSR